jgi:hypothetical protein
LPVVEGVGVHWGEVAWRAQPAFFARALSPRVSYATQPLIMNGTTDRPPLWISGGPPYWLGNRVLKSTLHHTGHYSPCFINNTLFDTLLGVKKVLSRLTTIGRSIEGQRRRELYPQRSGHHAVPANNLGHHDIHTARKRRERNTLRRGRDGGETAQGKKREGFQRKGR